MYTSKVSEEDQKAFWSNADCTWEQLETKFKADQAAGMDDMRLYCLSKAVLHVYTMQTAKQHPNLKVSVVTPGLVETNMTAKFDMPGKITPEQGTISTRHCLFNELQGNGWFYGSDGIRSPLLKGRNPGEPAYDGN